MELLFPKGQPGKAGQRSLIFEQRLEQGQGLPGEERRREQCKGPEAALPRGLKEERRGCRAAAERAQERTAGLC